MSSRALVHQAQNMKRISRLTIAAGVFFLVIAFVLCRALVSPADPDPLDPHTTNSAALLDIAILVFREGLECILVLAAITASMTGPQQNYRRPVAIGSGIGFGATLITWFIAVGILNDISDRVSALNLQAGTGLLAIVILLIVMNWFFHKTYWTGWISLHNRRKRSLLEGTSASAGNRRIVWGLGLLGFSSVYREGVEVVLFLQSYRLRLGSRPVLQGVVVGLLFTAIVGILTFLAHRKLPYRKMLVFTGMMLGVVLLVMVGEQAQEMQIAHWLTTTQIPWLANRLPAWAGLWLSVFPTVETLVGQAIALTLVLGSYVIAQKSSRRSARKVPTMSTTDR